MFCYDELSTTIYQGLQFGLFSEGVPVLVYYSHLTALVVSLVLSFFIILNNRTLPARILVTISLIFSALSILDILLWTQIDARIVMFLWSFWLFLFIATYILSAYFLYAFITKRDVGFPLKALGVAVLTGVLFLSASHYNLTAFDLYNCSAVEGIWVLNIVFGLSFVILVLTAFLGIKASLATKNGGGRQNLLATLGITAFLVTFSASTYVASIANFFGSAPDTFNLEQYGYFGMTIFIAALTYIIVKYKAFNIKLIAAQALVAALVILIGSQFFFIRNPINKVLNSITLVIAIGFGYLLIRSVQREIEQRIQTEKLARELEESNRQQVILIHFITHQIKGFVAKSRNIFAMIKEGEYGPVPPQMLPMVEEGFRSDTKGAETIAEILNAANIKSGKVAYTMTPIDMKAMIEGIVADLQPHADKKGLALTSTLEQVTFTGDKGQLVNAFKNLIDNSIKYTPNGSVHVSLAKTDRAVCFEITDTGVGIGADDMKNLFTEGGHGKNSQKINVESTGFGLYIVKNIIEAHKGRVWAESEGEGKGSRFIVELPASA
jgi:signal transduction histidine kinase